MVDPSLISRDKEGLIIVPDEVLKVSQDSLDDEFGNIFLCERYNFDSKIWRWRPVPVSEWMMGKGYLNLKKVLRKVVYDDVVEFFKTTDGNPWNRLYNEAAFCEGIGSGKSYKTSIIVTYFMYLLLCLREPQEYFGGDKSSKIAIMNMSISAINAKKVIFSEIKSKIDSCEWFLEKPWHCPDARMPDPNCVSELRFKNNTCIMPGSSSWRTAVGYAIMVGIMDEAGAYRTTDNSDQAEDIYHTLQRRLGSRFEEKGAIILAGSPLYENDFLERKLKEGQEEGSNVLSRRRNLWDAKYPDWDGDYFYIDKVNRVMLDEKPKEEDMKDVDAIPRIPFLFKAFKANVTKALRDFGGTPSTTINAFFEAPKIVLERVNKERTKDPVDNFGRFAEWFKPMDKEAFHTIHVDLAISGDACGLALGHYDGTTPEGATKIYIDLVMRMQGSKEAHIKISKIRDYIYALTALGFNLELITYDGFQSTDSLQILESKGYEVELLSVDRTTVPYYDLKEAINENRLDYYNIKSGTDEPSASEVLVRELMCLEEIEGKKIDHPPKGSKDVADGVAGVVHNVIRRTEYFGEVTVDII